MLAFTPPDDDRRTARLEQRMSPHAKQLIERAAALQGVSASEFVMAHSMSAARDTIGRLEVTHLSADDRQAFLSALDDDAPNPVLVDILDRHARLAESDPGGR